MKYQNLQYNLLNLPSKITYQDGRMINYVYSATGTKLSVTYTNGGTTTNNQYCGNMLYENGTLKQILIDGGYITFNGSTPQYHFYLKDHLGNNRVVVNASGTMEQVNHYYPFGGLMGESTNGDIQRYKYNGKELDRMNGLDWYDYGARHMDGIRFTTIDPMAEKYYGVSPYVYCKDNPIKFIDINGLEPGDFFKTKDEAAIDFGLFYNDNSIRENSEYGSTIFRIKNSKGEIGYTYTIANVGKRDGVIVSKSPDALNDVATIHTHGAYSNEAYYDNEFSGLRTTENNNYRLLSKTERIKQKGNNDIGNANRRKLDSYLVTPNGSLQKYEPNSNKITIVSNDMPSDKNDPSRLNLKDSQERNPYTMEDFLRMINKVFFNQ